MEDDELEEIIIIPTEETDETKLLRDRYCLQKARIRADNAQAFKRLRAWSFPIAIMNNKDGEPGYMLPNGTWYHECNKKFAEEANKLLKKNGCIPTA